MMKQYLRERKERERKARLTGIVMTVALHLCAVLLVSFSGMKYLYPPPAENTFLMDFSEDETPVEQKRGKAPQGEDVDKEKPLKLVQRSQSPNESVAQNLTHEGQPDNFGDVETPAPEPKEPEIDKNALFPGMSKKDTSLTAPHSAETAAPEFKAGDPKGNVPKGDSEGKPNAHLEGRTVDKAGLKKPVYKAQAEGRVVVDIWVDQYGKVVKAIPGGDGTTVTDKALWTAARNAALETGFNMKADAPALQQGTITYIFYLK